jgi:hypothetical protein
MGHETSNNFCKPYGTVRRCRRSRYCSIGQDERCSASAAASLEILNLSLASPLGSRVRFRFSRPHLEENGRGRGLKTSGLNWITEWLRLGIISTCARSKSAYTAFAFAIVKLICVSAVAKLFSRAFDCLRRRNARRWRLGGRGDFCSARSTIRTEDVSRSHICINLIIIVIIIISSGGGGGGGGRRHPSVSHVVGLRNCSS